MPQDYNHPAPTFTESTQSEYGLRLPNGKEVWPPELFYGQSYQTGPEREVVMVAIRDGLANLSMPPERLDEYNWVARIRRSMTTVVYDEDLFDIPITMTEEPRDDVRPVCGGEGNYVQG